MFDNLADPPPNMLFATILRRRRDWWVMWIGRKADVPPGDTFHAPTLTTAVNRASAAAAHFCRDNPASPAGELLFMIFGRSKPIFNFQGPQLQVAGEPGRLTATDVVDHSVHHGATLEDLVASAGGNPAKPGDYALIWNRAVPTDPS